MTPNQYIAFVAVLQDPETSIASLIQTHRSFILAATIIDPSVVVDLLLRRIEDLDEQVQSFPVICPECGTDLETQ